MKSDAKKIQSAAQVEGEDFVRYIQCDLDESMGRPVAVLFWPGADERKWLYELNPAELSPSDTAGVTYVHTGNPLRISKALTQVFESARPLTDDGFRLGFFFLPDSPSDSR